MEIVNGAVAIKHKGNISDVSISDLEELEEQIGNHFFYSKERALEDLYHPKGFREYLFSLEEEFNRKYP